jgi:hypothetical protein
VAFVATAGGVQAAETEEIEGDMGADCVGPEPPPQAVRISAITPTKRPRKGSLSCLGLLRFRRELII